MNKVSLKNLDFTPLIVGRVIPADWEGHLDIFMEWGSHCLYESVSRTSRHLDLGC